MYLPKAQDPVHQQIAKMSCVILVKGKQRFIYLMNVANGAKVKYTIVEPLAVIDPGTFANQVRLLYQTVYVVHSVCNLTSLWKTE